MIAADLGAQKSSRCLAANIGPEPRQHLHRRRGGSTVTQEEGIEEGSAKLWSQLGCRDQVLPAAAICFSFFPQGPGMLFLYVPNSPGKQIC